MFLLQLKGRKRFDGLDLMGKLLWRPSKELIDQANLTRFIDFVSEKRKVKIGDYWQLYTWSIERIPDFWEDLWQFLDIKTSRGYNKAVENLSVFPGTRWFPGARLNFAENLLRYRDEQPAFVFEGESRKSVRMSYAELYSQVAILAKWLRLQGLVAGDRACAYMPNLIETIVAMLACTSIGATWASCGSELGPSAVLDRLGQIEPKVMFTSDGYFYGNKIFNILQHAETMEKSIRSLQKIILIPYATSSPSLPKDPKFVRYEDVLHSNSESRIEFTQLPFDHPVYVMFSSGTTGKPKCMVQGVGVLLNELKDTVLHADLKRSDKITYITSASWMMWNWLVSALGSGATIILYDGNPNYPDWRTMWKLIQDEHITIFGCSATYINYLRIMQARPIELFNLSSLREISQTGSTLSSEGFEWVYECVKKDFLFNSISGGTDINGVFAGGNPLLPVYAGELASPYLGMKITAYDEKGNPILDREGELVCEAPSPSMPIYFWNDPEDKTYTQTYFDFFSSTGKNVWRHGDYIIVHSTTRGITFLGRSDSILKPSGVRIGTAEIYSIIEKMPEIEDSVVIGQKWKADQRVILFVKLAPKCTLTEELQTKIRRTLRENASPRHVPALILDVPDIPYTFNMKKVESAVRNIVEGKPVTNRSALTNPESLEYYQKILPFLRKEDN